MKFSTIYFSLATIVPATTLALPLSKESVNPKPNFIGNNAKSSKLADSVAVSMPNYIYPLYPTLSISLFPLCPLLFPSSPPLHTPLYILSHIPHQPQWPLVNHLLVHINLYIYKPQTTIPGTKIPCTENSECGPQNICMQPSDCTGLASTCQKVCMRPGESESEGHGNPFDVIIWFCRL